MLHDAEELVAEAKRLVDDKEGASFLLVTGTFRGRRRRCGWGWPGRLHGPCARGVVAPQTTVTRKGCGLVK